ncbi:MAG: S1C family serine protease [Anaerovoracaceae bacterium]
MSKKKRRLLSIAALCIVCTLIGSFSSVAILKYVYADALSALEAQPAVAAAVNSHTDYNHSMFSYADSSLTQKNDSPVVRVAKEVGPAVVGITNHQTISNVYRYRYGFDFGSGNSSRDSQLVEVGTGSGFIIDAKNGYIITNHHVIENAQKITVNLSDGRSLDAKVVGKDSRTDLAVLQISDTSNLTEVKLGDSSALEVGEYVVAIGNPGGNEFARSVTAGVISATNRTLRVSSSATLYNMLQTDAAINPGNSGGPLVNYSGEVIGINSAKFAENGFEGMGFAIPISDAIPIIKQLIENGAAKHPALMVSVSDQYLQYAKQHNLPLGAYVYEIDPFGPAGKAGIQKGDIITHVDNVRVENSTELIGEIYKHNVGDKVTLTFIRNGQTKTVKVTLGEMTS